MVNPTHWRFWGWWIQLCRKPTANMVCLSSKHGVKEQNIVGIDGIQWDNSPKGDPPPIIDG